MDAVAQFEEYMAHLAAGLGHADRVAGLKDYCSGLMLPLSRKSVEPMAARIDPLHASARHQALHHFVAKAQWSDGELLRRVAQWVVPHMDFSRGGYWLVDDTGFPKKGKHSVGVARQWCGMLGKQDNCQVAVSVSLACEQASLPVKWQLYLPESWTEDPERCSKAGVSEGVGFATKGEIALQQLQALLGRRRAALLRGGRRRLRHGRGIPSASHGHGLAIHAGRDLVGHSVAAGCRTAACAAVFWQWPPAGGHAAHA